MEGQGLYVMYEHNERGPWCPAFQKKESWGSLFPGAPQRNLGRVAHPSFFLPLSN
jgi:hypothetical protein